MTKHKTKVKGVTVTVNASGSYTVTATAAAVKAWPWDGTSFPCSNLKHRHSFTFESNGDLCDMETRQNTDGINGEPTFALCDDCKALAVDLLSGLADIKPSCVSAIIYTGNRPPFVDGKGFVNSAPLDSWSFIYRSRKGEHNHGKRLGLHTCESGKAFSQHGEVSLDWITENRCNRVKWEAVPAALRAHVKSRLQEASNRPPRFKLWTRGNRGIYFDNLEAAQKAANAVFQKTGIVLLITEEKGRAAK